MTNDEMIARQARRIADLEDENSSLKERIRRARSHIALAQAAGAPEIEETKGGRSGSPGAEGSTT